MNKHTNGPWELFICDDGGEWTGWPISIQEMTDQKSDSKTIVRTGGFYPYTWDTNISQDEAIANAKLIAAAPELLAALELAKTMMIANEVNLPNTMEVINEAISKAKGK